MSKEVAKEVGLDGIENVFGGEKFVLTWGYRHSRSEIVKWMFRAGEKTQWGDRCIVWLGEKSSVSQELILETHWKIKESGVRDESEYKFKRDEWCKLFMWVDNFDVIFCKRANDKQTTDAYDTLKFLNDLMWSYRTMKLKDMIDEKTSVEQHLGWVLDAVFFGEDYSLLMKIACKNRDAI